LGTIGSVAAVCAIGSVGWYSAIAYYDLRIKAEAVYTSATLHEYALERDELRKAVASKDAELKTIQQQLTVAQAHPTENDWYVLNSSFLQLYAGVASFAGSRWDGASLEDIQKVTDPNGLYKFLSKYMEKKIELAGLSMALAAKVSGAGLIGKVMVDGQEYLMPAKAPFCRVNLKTNAFEWIDPEQEQKQSK
jgi:hypothetical protein